MDKENEENSGDLLYGEIIFFIPKRGFGFIKTDNGSSDIFFHFSELVMEGFKTIRAGTKVSFKEGKNIRDQLVAKEVTAISE